MSPSLTNVPCLQVSFSLESLSASFPHSAPRVLILSMPFGLPVASCGYAMNSYSSSLSLAADGSAVHEVGLDEILKGGQHLQKGSRTLASVTMSM